jgi:hypothetical protein
MQNKILSWACVLLLLALPLVLMIIGHTTTPPNERPAAANSQAAPKAPADSTQRMAQRLRRLSEQIDIPNVMWGANDRRVTMCRQELARAKDVTAQLSAEFFLASELLKDGQNEECIRHLDDLNSLARKVGGTFPDNNLQDIRMLRVQAYLRIGESQNCCAEHNADSCLMPLRGEAIYQHQEGPRQAIQLLEEQLAEVPGDPIARWLLNISYMTKGEYPGGVPKQWLIDPKAFESEYPLKRFPEVASAAGLDTYGLSGGAIVDDFDGDGLLDVVRSDMGFAAQMRFFHNNGDGTFSDRTDAAGLTGEVGGLNITSADFNNDGYLDILVLRGGWLGKGALFPKSLIRNNGDGTFTDVTEEAGLLTAYSTQTAVWLDYDGDGWLDVFVGSETTEPAFPQPCELFHNNRDGTFTECAAANGIRIEEFVKAVASDDYNKDGRPDLYISQRGGLPNSLFRNDGPRDPANPKAGWKFTNVTGAAGLAKPISSFPCWFFDYDNDGWQDIFVGGFSGSTGAIVAEYSGQPSEGEHPRLYHNNGNGTFTDLAPNIGLNMTISGMAGNFGDLDNDGFLDFYLGTGEPGYTALHPNRMFRNAGGERFQDVTTAGGFGNLQKGHAISFADINNDGQQDIYEVMGGAFTGDKYYSVLYANPGHDAHWVTLKLEGVQSNRGAVGARVRVIVATPNGERSIYRTVTTGGSFGCSPLRQQIGLGDARAIAGIEIFWPVTGQTQRLPGVPMDHFYKVREGERAAVAWKLPAFPLRGTAAAQLSRR